MTKLAWGSYGERFFETGTDRGVLYLPLQSGVPWNGLKAITESPSGGEPTPYYIDGFKYLNVASAEEFEASLAAFSSPRAFDICDGTLSIHNGLFATQQPRQPFNLSYRTLIGNDAQDIEHGYKIHIVYNALAGPSERSNQTIGDATTPLELSWAITTTPPKMSGLKPTAHLVIDSRITPLKLMTEIEDILYGTDSLNARLPTVDELMALFKSTGPISRYNTVTTPRPFAYLDSGWVAQIDLRGNPESGWLGGVLTTAAGPYIQSDASENSYLAGDQVTLTIRYRVTVNSGMAAFITAMPHLASTNVSYRDGYQITRPIIVGVDETVLLQWITPVNIVVGDLDVTISTSTEDGLTTVSADIGFAMQATNALIEPGWTVGSYFDGDTPDTDITTYDWAATPNASQSTLKTWY